MVKANYNKLNTSGRIQEWDGFTTHFVITALNPDTYVTYEVDGYLLTRQNEDGSLYAIRVVMGKVGGAMAWVDQWAKAFTKQLRNAPLIDLCKEGMRQQFEPAGGTNVPGIARCDSPVDLVCKIIMMRYLPEAWAEMKEATKP